MYKRQIKALRNPRGTNSIRSRYRGMSDCFVCRFWIASGCPKTPLGAGVRAHFAASKPRGGGDTARRKSENIMRDLTQMHLDFLQLENITKRGVKRDVSAIFVRNEMSRIATSFCSLGTTLKRSFSLYYCCTSQYEILKYCE